MNALLPSGLPDLVADEESLARVLRHSSHFTAAQVKASAFLPAKDGMTSVIRHGEEPRDELWRLAEATLGAAVKVHGAAICKARVIRDERLEVLADEPPPRHANLAGWPINADPELQKAQQKEIALAIASRTVLVRPDVRGE
jgi:hypothetical protein